LRCFPRDEEYEGSNANNSEDDDEARGEPVLHQATVQNHFERAQEGRDKEEADQIEADPLICRLCVLHQRRDERHGCEADGAVDEEVPVPGIIVGEPAAECGSHDRRHDHRNAEQGEGLAAFFGREGIRKDRLRHRHHAAAAQPLQDTE
jgi:hypothetical protein